MVLMGLPKGGLAAKKAKNAKKPAAFVPLFAFSAFSALCG